MTYRETMNFGVKFLEEADILDAKTDAWLLFEAAGKIDRAFYYLHMEDEIPTEVFHEYELALKKGRSIFRFNISSGKQSLWDCRLKSIPMC